MEHTKISKHFDILTWIPNIGSRYQWHHWLVYFQNKMLITFTHICSCFLSQSHVKKNSTLKCWFVYICTTFTREKRQQINFSCHSCRILFLFWRVMDFFPHDLDLLTQPLFDTNVCCCWIPIQLNHKTTHCYFLPFRLTFTR